MNGPHLVHRLDPFYEQAISEHRHLLCEATHIRCLLRNAAQAPPSDEQARELVRRTQQLREHLSRHFQQEQEGGYLEEALIRMPRLSTQAAVLQREHADLLEELTWTLERMSPTERSADAWRARADEFEQFTRRLAEHETAENELLQQAFNEAQA